MHGKPCLIPIFNVHASMGRGQGDVDGAEITRSSLLVVTTGRKRMDGWMAGWMDG